LAIQLKMNDPSSCNLHKVVIINRVTALMFGDNASLSNEI